MVYSDDDIDIFTNTNIKIKGKSLIMYIISSFPELNIRDFPQEYFKIFDKLEKSYEKFATPYDYTHPITEIFEPTELIKGLQELRQEKINFIRETQKYLPSNLFVAFPPLQRGVYAFNELINLVDSYVGILKIEKPDLVDDSVALDLNNPFLFNYFRSLSGRDIILDKGYLCPIDQDFILEDDYDRFTGEKDSRTLNKLLKKYKLKLEKKKDETILSCLTNLENSKELQDYLSKIADPSLLIYVDNFKDLYDLYMMCTECDVDSKFTMDRFYGEYESIRKTVFSNSISKFSPRLVKLIVTIETTK